jgi:hypothetical protein
MPPYSNRNKLDDLTEQAGELVTQINRLNAGTGVEVEGLNRKVRRSQKMMALIAVSLLANLILTVAVAFTVHSTVENTQQVDAVTQRLDHQQNVTRKQVLCPLYQIFVDSKSDQGRKAYPQGPKEYDRVFKVIEKAYDTIQCADVKPRD